MSARKFDQPLEACGCGAKPCIHRREAGHHRFLHQISCTRCGVATIQSDDFNEVVSLWNEGQVKSPAGDPPAAEVRAGAPAKDWFNPVLP